MKFDERGDRFIRTFWEAKTLTGDNLRERLYAYLYPRLTTESNTYTVHMRVQVLRKRSAARGTKKEQDQQYTRWNEDKDRALSEHRGSCLIESYLDPKDWQFDPQNKEP